MHSEEEEESSTNFLNISEQQQLTQTNPQQWHFQAALSLVFQHLLLLSSQDKVEKKPAVNQIYLQLF